MVSFELRFARSVLQDLERVPKDMVHSILQACRGLAEKPRSRRFRKLAAGGVYCFRVDEAVIAFTMRRQKITILTVAYRQRTQRSP